MKIIANGFPKAGVHALKKSLELLGHPIVPPFQDGITRGHFPISALDDPDFPKDAKHIVIFRNPRNCLISMHRMLYPTVTPKTGDLIKLLRNYYNNDSSFKDSLIGWMEWRKRDEVMIVTYEDLMKDDTTLRKIADYLGTPYYEGAWEGIEGMTVTWNAVKSNWKDHWNNDIENFWKAEGLDLLEKELGYENVWNSSSQ